MQTMDDNVDQTPPFPLLLPPPPSLQPSTPTHHRKKRSKLTTIITTPPKTPYKKPDPSAPKITPPCTECGKTFWSWKALFGHMRCHPEREWRGINPPPHLRRDTTPATPAAPVQSPVFTPSPDEREVAASLLLLASSDHNTKMPGLVRFECSGCKKTFPSHQALGGHRASHKNVKGCFAVEEQGYNCNLPGNIVDEMDLGLGLVLGLGHKCGICFKKFLSGQALGGHMRCHWEKNEDGSTSSFGPGFGLGPGPVSGRCGLDIDLNMPAQVVDDIQLDLRLGI